MSAIKREYERIAEVLLRGDYDDLVEEVSNLEALGMTLGHLPQLIDTAKAIAPNCECGANYFEGITSNDN
jgi:hypothetical protein